MAVVTIEKIFKKMIETKYGERENIGLKVVEGVIQDINGDDVAVAERWLNGFRDKNHETDKWVEGMKVKILINEKEYTKKDGTKARAINFKLPEGQSSIIETPPADGPVADSDIDPDDF